MKMLQEVQEQRLSAHAQDLLAKHQHPSLHSVQLDYAEKKKSFEAQRERARSDEEDRRRADMERQMQTQQMFSSLSQGILDLRTKVTESEKTVLFKLAASEAKHAHEIELINNRLGLIGSDPAGTNADHVHRLPDRPSASTGDPQLHAPGREEPAYAVGIEESKSSGHDTHQETYTHQENHTVPRDHYRETERNFGMPTGFGQNLFMPQIPQTPWVASATMGTQADHGRQHPANYPGQIQPDTIQSRYRQYCITPSDTKI